MKNYWKQFAGWATVLKYNVFRVARLKLTLLYIGIIAVILIIFSLVLYYSLAQNIRNNLELEGEFSNEQTQESVILKTTDQLQTTIFFIDLLILLASSGLSYFLAGKTLRPIQQAMERQKQFTADASHELRTPLAVIQTNLEVALREKDWNREKSQVLITNALEEVNLMTKLTEDLLILSRLENEKKDYAFKKINIARLVNNVVEKMQNLATKRRIRLSVAPLPAAFIEGDANALERLMMNIVTNALQFTPAEGSVRVTADYSNKQITIRVQDTGVGIAKEDLPHIFERFYRADKARRCGNGTGLGLSIAQEIAHKHNGNIQIESKLGEGTIVTIILPVIS